MKKFLILILLISGIRMHGNAQLMCDLSLELVDGSDTNITLNVGDSARLYLKITNYGPDTLDTTDYVFFRINVLPPNIYLVATDTATFGKVMLNPDSSFITHGMQHNYENVFSTNDTTIEYCFYFPESDEFFYLDTNHINDTVCYRITYKVPEPSSIHNYDDNDIFVVYPNPTSDFVYVKFSKESYEPASIRIFNAVGQLIASYNLNNVSTDFTKKIDVSSYAPGIYYLEASTKTHYQKAIISKLR